MGMHVHEDHVQENHVHENHVHEDHVHENHVHKDHVTTLQTNHHTTASQSCARFKVQHLHSGTHALTAMFTPALQSLPSERDTVFANNFIRNLSRPLYANFWYCSDIYRLHKHLHVLC